MTKKYACRHNIQYKPDLAVQMDGKERVEQQRGSSKRDYPTADRIVVLPLFIREPGAYRADSQAQKVVEPIRPRQEGQYQ